MRHHFKPFAYSIIFALVVIAAGQIGSSMTYDAPRAAAATTTPATVEDEPDPIPPDYTGLKTVMLTADLPHELTFFAEVSAYTSSVDETDDTPNINAMGTRPGPGSIACPTRYAFGTKVMINGDEFSCDDRMNPRYAGGDYFDIWIETKAQAFQWGRRTVEVIVIE